MITSRLAIGRVLVAVIALGIILGLVVAVEIPAIFGNQTTTTHSTSVATTSSRNSTTRINSTSAASSFTFNDSRALSFLESLKTRTRLLETFAGSNTTYLADDQALDYAALMKLGDYSMANNISSSMNPYGGLYGHWNAVFVLLNQFPSAWNFSFPQDYFLGNNSGYSVWVTRFTQQGSAQDYTAYSDLELYYSFFLLHTGEYSGAINAFSTANSHWDGRGFADKAYNYSSNGYDSYKLAVDLIVFKALMTNPNTEGAIVSYNSTLTQVQSVMSNLQGGDGGVISNYDFLNGAIKIAANTYENGETTSLFILAQ